MHYRICLLGILVMLSSLLSGCGALLETEYQRPETTTPAQWNGLAAEVNATVTDAARWPTDFGDETLAELVRLALERNNDLAAATVRLRQARLAAGQAFDDLLPDFSASTGSDSQKSLKKGDWSIGYSVSGSVSYEADLWGKYSRAHDAAEWEALASAQDRQSTALSLVGDVMELYWQIAYRNVRLRLSESNIESAVQVLEVERSQAQFGAASNLEVRQAEQDLASLRAEHQTLVQNRREDLNALAILFDMPPGETMADPQELMLATLPELPAGLPAQLLSRRPDLRAAELRLREMLAEVDAARAGFYPSLTLSSSLGSSSTTESLATLFENPLATAASSIVLPFLNWNNLQLKVDVSKAEYDEAVINFRQTLYEAMAEVEDALSERSTLAERGKWLEENLSAAREVERIYQVRYDSGYCTFKDWLETQDTLRSAEQSLAENRYNQLVNYVTLYQALGGQPAATLKQ